MVALKSKYHIARRTDHNKQQQKILKCIHTKPLVYKGLGTSVYVQPLSLYSSIQVEEEVEVLLLSFCR